MQLFIQAFFFYEGVLEFRIGFTVQQLTNLMHIGTSDQFFFQIGDLGDREDLFDIRVLFQELNVSVENVHVVFVGIEDQNNGGFSWQFTKVGGFDVILNRI